MSSPTLFAGQNPNAAFAVSSRSSTMRASSAIASRCRSLAAAPTTGSSRIAGYAPAQLPGREERRPVDPADEVIERMRLDRPNAEEGRPRRSHRAGSGPVDREAVPARLRDRVPGLALLPFAPVVANLRVLVADARCERVAPLAVEQRRCDTDGPRRVEDVDDGAVVARLDLDRRVRPRRRRAADQQREW